MDETLIIGGAYAGAEQIFVGIEHDLPQRLREVPNGSFGATRLASIRYMRGSRT